jgi:hypothetical protein
MTSRINASVRNMIKFQEAKSSGTIERRLAVRLLGIGFCLHSAYGMKTISVKRGVFTEKTPAVYPAHTLLR